LKNNYLAILCFLIFSISYGQKETANWFFGEYAGLNFKNKTPVPLVGKLATREGCAAISNDKGALLFYTDGTSIWNKNHNVMPNGVELFGNNSSTQSAIIIPDPLQRNIYYVFTVNNGEKLVLNEEKKGLNYSIVDMNLDNGNGDVVPESKNIHLITYKENDAKEKDWKCSEKIAATLHGDGNSYWVLTHFTDTFYAFKIDENGLSETPIKSKVNEVIPIVELQDINTLLTNIASLGYLKISPNGKKIAIAHSATAKTRTSGKFILYDFDNTTGMVSPNGTVLLSGTYPYGVEFSPKSRKLYVTTNEYSIVRGVLKFDGGHLFQFDLENENVSGSKTEIHTSPSLIGGALQLAINGKIYRARSKPGEGENSLAVINKPELIGKNIAYVHNGVELAANTKSNYGLPPFISSSFILTFDYEFTCIGDETHFFITSDDPYDSLVWDFGDGTKSTDPEPYHRYKEPGEYTVSLSTTYNDYTSKPLVKKVEIVGIIDVITTPFTFIECDTDLYPEDGITTFNLQLANDAISLGKGNEVDVFYYKDMATLENDTLNSNALPNYYENAIPDEPILAKVLISGSDCYNVADVVLRATKTFEFVAEKMIGCNQGDGTAQFDLANQEQFIVSDLGLPVTTTVSFHQNKSAASLGYEPFDENYIGSPGTIFIRLVNDNICSGIGSMDLDMPILPRINQDELLNICSASFPYRIDAGVESFERQNYTYEWVSGEQTYEIEALAEGEYYLTITDKETLCSIVRSITISRVASPIVKSIELEDNGISHRATILLENQGDFEFTLENPFGLYQQDPSFNELAPGSYTAFIRDRKNCDIVEKKFFIFGFPKFFTPNSDGDADIWEVKGLNPVDFAYSDIQIFNRFGKLLASIPPSGHWDGTYNGRTLPSDDYWFTVTVTDPEDISTTYIKHFSLISN